MQATQHAVTLFNIHAGLDPVADAASEQVALLAAIDAADAATQSLYLKLQPNSREADLYAGPATVETWDVIPSTFVGWDAYSSLPYTDSLMNALGRWTLNARLLGADPLGASAPNTTAGFFTVTHGTSVRPSGLYAALNESVVLVRDSASAQDSALLKTAASALAISLGIFALLAAAVIAPATSAVAREKHLLQVISLIPLLPFSSLRSPRTLCPSCHRRLCSTYPSASTARSSSKRAHPPSRYPDSRPRVGGARQHRQWNLRGAHCLRRLQAPHTVGPSRYMLLKPSLLCAVGSILAAPMHWTPTPFHVPSPLFVRALKRQRLQQLSQDSHRPNNDEGGAEDVPCLPRT